MSEEPQAQGKRGKAHRFRAETVYGELYDPTADHEDLPKPPPKTEEQMQDLLKKVKHTAFLKEIDEVRLRAALSHMTLSNWKAKEYIYKQGTDGDKFFIVAEGKYKSFRKLEDQMAPEFGDQVGTYDDSNPCFGELALLYREKRSHTVQAETDGKLWEIERKLYTRIVVKLAYKKRQRHMKFMNKCPLLNLVQPYEKVRLCDAFVIKKFKAGEMIIKENQPADGMYWIEKGEVEVKKSEGGGDPIVLKAKDYFGEMALLTKKPRNATCTAKTDCELAFLESAAFERLMGKLHNIMLRDREKYKKVLKEEFGTEDPDTDEIR